ncbi:MAG: phosphohydrolase [Crocinitomicaceae bacterium]|nr:phosphohydrolase [Crocinitomicaceae bacterium]HBP45102.1 phosphohydrolase [Flavobacteriales bacterium]|tara:strand:- start:4154 stop:5389 length:1236 start_codon:yes stop_codon:yes gene_type:complete
MSSHNKHKILNDPVYGFITIQHELSFDLMDHPYVQRLRRISQLGLSHLVYPGAVHNRFHHAIGALHLMQEAIAVLQAKGTEISPLEAEGACAAILLHDIGHGPFSHALEHSIVKGVQHEDISTLIMARLNEIFNGALDTAIAIFNDHHPKKFLHQLVSSQLDMDRMDYLARDSFYSGVAEGNIGSERIIKMLAVADNELVVEEKGVYSIEKFLMARRLMYWQVYLHRTVLCAEFMLVTALKRAKELAQEGIEIHASPALRTFIYDSLDRTQFFADEAILDQFCLLDDSDILAALKVWQFHKDFVLSEVSRRIVHRDLFRINLRPEPFEKKELDSLLERIVKKYGIGEREAKYLIINDRIDNKIYESGGITILFKNGIKSDFADASDQLSREILMRTVAKSFICYPKELETS